MSRTLQDQISQMDWGQLRRQYREENHRRVVEVEGLRVDKHTGDVKGRHRLEAMGDWNDPSCGFVIPVSRGLERELEDLGRDADLVEMGESVRHEGADGVVARTFMPRIEGDVERMTDEELDRELQKIVVREW